jgi:hypothetical protein
LQFTNDGLSLWYGTPDAPAPGDGGVVRRTGASLVIGARPANPTNSVLVQYRVDGGRVQSIPGREMRTDFDRQVQYFAVAFPPFITGDVVEFSVTMSCAGRQVPAPQLADRFPSKFRLAPKEASTNDASTKPAVQRSGTASVKQRFETKLEFVADVKVYYGAPLYVGDTPTGMRINFLAREGTVKGNGFNGKVLESSVDSMIVRPDGMGVVRIRAVLGLDDGAVLDVESGGYVDFGPDGYRKAKNHDLPPHVPITLSPLITTKHPKYQWLSRVQCIGTGFTHLDGGWASYRVYACVLPPQ